VDAQGYMLWAGVALCIKISHRKNGKKYMTKLSKHHDESSKLKIVVLTGPTRIALSLNPRHFGSIGLSHSKSVANTYSPTQMSTISKGFEDERI
jgi:hypothetical protein